MKLNMKGITRFSFLYFPTILVIYLTFPVRGSLRFVSFGNWGTGSKTQRLVAEKLKEWVKAERVTYLLSPGFNFEKGVGGVNDEKWKKMFESVYSDEDGGMDLPMFTVLGSEDWQGDYDAQYQRYHQYYLSGHVEGKGLDYTSNGNKKTPRLIMPNWWYHFFTSFSTSAGESAGNHRNEVPVVQHFTVNRSR